MEKVKGFTILELVTVIMLVSILAASAVMLWPRGMKEDADLYEIRHAMRYAQHLAMTRPWDPAHPWGFRADSGGNKYSILKHGTTVYAKDPDSGADMNGIALRGDASMECDVNGIPKSGIWFDRFGTPLDYSSLEPITSLFRCYTGGRTVIVHPETGYVE